ncbi:MAG: carbamoyltransferase HypF [Planctomycetota bacterium]|nr:carbamoyltransferase HypF [Planctomycetota bacterium]
MSGSSTGKPLAADTAVRRRIRVRGIVQGVGFRPAVYRLATERGLGGWVLNDAEGVLVELEGPAARIDDFLADLRDHPPPLARITAVETSDVAPRGETAFGIAASAGGEKTALVSPDMAVCDDCLREMNDPRDRRYRYPFINCTNCGPRYSIIIDIPYDRPKTTMRAFTMCPLCRREYEDPTDRRFHAQPTACPVCGPRLALHDASGAPVACDNPVRAVREALLAGRIVAIKGLTGFHLAADARNEAAMRELRRRKGRDQKAFAMMGASVEAIARCAVVGESERTLLESRERPIVLLEKRPGHGLSPLVAPASPYFGFMLPYAPLHYLLFEDDFPPMVMTSGNLSEEPICREDQEAVTRLAGIADLYLMHDRPIHTVCDDSVTMVQRGRPLMLRRGRGFAPRPLVLPVESPEPILAVGPELKNAVCLVRGRQAFVSQHIGDLKNALAAGYFETTINKIERLLEVRPQVVVHDLHPGYLSTRYARRRGAEIEERIRLIGVQHHHAHIAGVMAENGLTGEVIGLAMDGTGYGPDGTIWGGEVLRASAAHFERLGHLSYVALAGGDAAVEHPVRIAWAFLLQAYGLEEALRKRVGRVAQAAEKDLRLWAEMIEKGVNSPLACGLGRLFDAASALSGVCDDNSYEGQPAVELEGAAEGQPDNIPPYEFAIINEDVGSAGLAASQRRARSVGAGKAATAPQGWVLDTLPVIRGIVADIEAGRGGAETSARFHATVAAMLLAAARRAREESGLGRIALSGGCFANHRLMRALAPALEAEGFEVYVHREVSPGDGGVALGQAYVAAARLCEQREQKV